MRRYLVDPVRVIGEPEAKPERPSESDLQRGYTVPEASYVPCDKQTTRRLYQGKVRGW